MQVESVIRCILLGDEGVGKSELVHAYIAARPKSDRRQIDRKVISSSVRVNGRPCELVLVDYTKTVIDQFNELGYQYSVDRPDIVLLCFSLGDPATLASVEDHWESFIRRYLSNIPVILVGTKADIKSKLIEVECKRNEESGSYVSYHDGKQVADAIGAVDYFECSATKHENLLPVFDATLKEAMKANKSLYPINKKCCIL